MSDPIPDGDAGQFRSLFRTLVLDPDLILGRILSLQSLAAVVAREVGSTCDRIFTPLVTLAVFLAQVLSDDHSCRGAVAKLLAWRAAQGLNLALPTPAATARHGGASLKPSCRNWSATPPRASRRMPPRTGCSTAAVSSSPTARP